MTYLQSDGNGLEWINIMIHMKQTANTILTDPHSVKTKLLLLNAKTTRFLGSLVTLMLCAQVSPGFSQSGAPWTNQDFKNPAALAATLRDEKAAKPMIFNIGSVEQIKGAIPIGSAGKSAKLEEFKQQLAKLPKDKEIVIYCGCCPFQRCPNVRPAFDLLKQMKFTNAKILKIPTNLNDDWIAKGYPME